MKINILCFGITKDITGAFQMTWELPEESETEHLFLQLKEKYPGLIALTSLKLALNNNYASPADRLKEGDEIALIPPVSGG